MSIDATETTDDFVLLPSSSAATCTYLVALTTAMVSNPVLLTCRLGGEEEGIRIMLVAEVGSQSKTTLIPPLDSKMRPGQRNS